MLKVIVVLASVVAHVGANNGVTAQSQPVTFRVADCSGGYSCMKKPGDCTDDNCELIGAWTKVAGDNMEFILISKMQGNTGYVTVGFDKDSQLDNVRATTCAYDGQTISLYNAYNSKYESTALGGSLTSIGIAHAHGDVSNGYLRCRFIRSMVPTNFREIARLDGSLHISLAAGSFTPPFKQGSHYDTPMVSNAQDLKQSAGLVGTHDPNQATRPYWRAHGCLMITAWVLIALAASLQPRYYRQMWPNSKICGFQIWFALHVFLMILATILFTIAFIIALYTTGGEYRVQPNLPQRAHPILGLIALILGWATPIIALFRCDPADHYRPIFNWIYFFVGTLAIVFAVINCFIGLTFQSVRAPAWTAWVLVAAVIFHLIVEILLELAGCFYYSKNKEKAEQFELRQQALVGNQEPEPILAKPEPAGRLFKSFMLVLHSIVMPVLVFAIIIGIALN